MGNARIIALGLASLAAACGKSKDQDPPAKTTPATTAAPTAAAPPTAPAPTTPPPAPPAPAPGPDLGACKVAVTGAITGEDEVPRNRASVLTDYWLGDKERAQIQSSTSGATAAMTDALKLLTLNCEGKTVRLSIIPGKDATSKSIPFGPKKYTLDKGKGDLAVMAHAGDQMVVNPSGTIDITAFDAHHIAATIDLAGTTMDRREVKLTGSLDYVCSDLSGCK